MEHSLSAQHLIQLSSWLGDAGTRKHGCPVKSLLEITQRYQVAHTVEQILRFSTLPTCNVALQFPDELLHHAPFIAEALHQQTEQVLPPSQSDHGFLYFILGDTSYGECCVDEVAAAHLNADIVVHYGNACLSPTQSLPALYVFPRFQFEQPQLAIDNLMSSITHVLSQDQVQQVFVLYDAELSECFREEAPSFNHIPVPLADLPFDQVRFATLRCRAGSDLVQSGQPQTEDDIASLQIGAHIFEQCNENLDRTAFLWVSKNDSNDEVPAAAYNAALELCTGPSSTCIGFYFTSLTSESGSMPTELNPSKLLRKRLAALSAAKNAERIGIVPGTLGISGSREVIDRCKKVIKSAGKRAYVILVGKPNPAKLANFAEIDAFVLVACPQNALIESREYLRPILTPLELEASLVADGDIFSNPYSTDFRKLLENELVIAEDDAESSVSGMSKDEGAVGMRGDWTVSVKDDGAAGAFLKSRHWQGLSYNSGGTDDQVAVDQLEVQASQGQTGIASKYDFEAGHSG